jgi:hypothetical protein
MKQPKEVSSLLQSGYRIITADLLVFQAVWCHIPDGRGREKGMCLATDCW